MQNNQYENKLRDMELAHPEKSMMEIEDVFEIIDATLPPKEKV